MQEAAPEPENQSPKKQNRCSRRGDDWQRAFASLASATEIAMLTGALICF